MPDRRPTLHWIQHVPGEGLGLIETWANNNGYECKGIRIHLGESLPSLESVDCLIVMGGPMSTRDEAKYPWLVAEKRFIESLAGKGKRILGICLGAQLIAEVLGARVQRATHEEIGWHRVRLTEKGRKDVHFQHFPWGFQAFHWHEESFEIPAGCIRLAESDACRNQAFSCGDRILGLQFHLEMSLTQVVDLLDSSSPREFPKNRPSVQNPGTIRELGRYQPHLDQLVGLLMSNL